jgi:hypothetical protein
MNKSLLAIACFAIPFASFAAEATAPAAAASAPAKVEAHSAAVASKAQSVKNGACRKEASDKGLNGVEYKTAVVECMKR